MDQESHKLLRVQKTDANHQSMKKFHDLRNLLSLQKNQQFEDELNNLSVSKKRLLNTSLKPKWNEKLKLTLDNNNNKVNSSVMTTTRNKTNALTPLRGRLISDNDMTSLNISRNLQDDSFLLSTNHNTSINQTQALDFLTSTISGHPDRKSALDSITQKLNPQTYFSTDSKIRKQSNPPIVYGSNLDKIFLSKESTLQSLRVQNNELKLENDQLKTLNAKLVERLDHLQNIIDKEANAKDYYFNYPPRPDSQLAMEVQAIQRSDKSPKNNKAIQKAQKQDEQLNKLKQIYDEKIERDKRLAERKLNDAEKSLTLEIDQLYDMLSKQCRDQIQLTGDYNQLSNKFNLYYSQSDLYIRDRETKLTQLSEENAYLQSDLDKFRQLYLKEKAEHEAIQYTHEAFLSQYEVFRQENVRLRQEVLQYEEKYKFIDIGKMHEKIQFLTSKLEASESKCKLVENDLFDLRDKILKATSKRFSMPGAKEIDGKPSIFLSESANGKQQKDQWNGEVEIEDTAHALLEFIHHEISTTMPRGSHINQWSTQINSPNGQDLKNDITRVDLM